MLRCLRLIASAGSLRRLALSHLIHRQTVSIVVTYVSCSACLDLGALVIPLGEAEAKSRPAVPRLRFLEKGAAFTLRAREGKAGRPPRALSKSGKTFAAQPIEHLADAWACIGTPLHRGVIAPHAGLQVADLFAECLEITCGKSRQSSLGDPLPKRLALALRKIRQNLESRSLARPSEPAIARIEDQEDAPMRREGDAGDELGQLSLARSCVKHGASLRKGCNADT